MLLALVIQWASPGISIASQAERQVVFHIANKGEAVVITKVTSANAVVQSGRFVKPTTEIQDPVTPFQADDDWVQDLTVYFFNRTNRNIVYMTVHVSFPETGDGQTTPRHGYAVTLGRIPAVAYFDRNGRPVTQRPGPEPISFKPGQTMAIHLGDYIDHIRTNVESAMPLAVTTRLHLDFGLVFFADGMQWGGVYSVPDRQTFTWKRMGPDYFPGDMDLNWPGRPGWNDEK